MKTLLILVGRTKEAYLSEGIAVYAGRLKHYMPFDIAVVPELKNTANMPEAVQKQREGEAILKLLLPNDTVVLLDERGRQPTSVELADWLAQKRRDAARLVLVVGGPYGFSPEVYDRAKEQISLSRMTFSHQMVRLILVEQLYRACTIINGEPYHHQ